jgi:hypothetical protein
MNLEFRSIVERGDHSKERITLRCLGETDLGHYVLLQTSSREGVASTDVLRTMWFPDKIVEKGDLIVLYTKSGYNSEKVLKTGKKAHFIYWDIPKPIWSDKETAVVLLHAPNWEARLVEDL